MENTHICSTIDEKITVATNAVVNKEEVGFVPWFISLVIEVSVCLKLTRGPILLGIVFVLGVIPA